MGTGSLLVLGSGLKTKSQTPVQLLGTGQRKTIIWKRLQGSLAAAWRIEPHRMQKGIEPPELPAILRTICLSFFKS